MKKILFFFLGIMYLASCNNKNKEAEFDSTKIGEINEIVKTVILEDSLNVLINGKESLLFCEELIKLDIFIPKKSKHNELNSPPPPPPPFRNAISIERLKSIYIENELFFSSTDSLCLLEQKLNPKKLKIEKSLAKNINLTSNEEETNKRKANKYFSYFEMTIPIFSKDKNKAYLELNHYCGGLCGSGVSIMLRKIKGKWKIVDKQETWVS